MMKQQTGIMFITNSLWPRGADHALLTLVQGLLQSGQYRPVIACLQEPGPLAEKFSQLGIPVFSELFRDKYNVLVIPRLARLMAQHRVRIVVPVGSAQNPMFWGTLAAKAIGAKAVVWSQTFSQPGHPEFELSNRILYPLVDHFVAQGRRHKECLTWRDKVPQGKITVIPNGIHLDHFGQFQWRDRARAILGLADENITAVAMIANLRPNKRHDIFIQAAQKVVAQCRNVHFFIIGDGPTRADVRAWAQKSDLLGHYLSILGFRDDITQLLPGLDLVCICSEFQECLSLVALQAMASGAPVASNCIGSMDDIITDNRTGFFYHPLAPDALAEKILDAIRKPDLRKQIAAAAQTQIEQHFTAGRMIDDFTQLFNRLLAAPYRRTNNLAILTRILSSQPK
jgi:glycosyltransferase involved in cell wall biosynthesis